MKAERLGSGYREFSPLVTFWTRQRLALTSDAYSRYLAAPHRVPKPTLHPRLPHHVGLLKDHCKEPGVQNTVLTLHGEPAGV